MFVHNRAAGRCHQHAQRLPEVESIDAVEGLKNLSTVGLIDTKVKDLSVLTIMVHRGQRVSLSRTWFRGNDQLIRCSPKSDEDIKRGKSCYEENGDLKPLWRRWLGL